MNIDEQWSNDSTKEKKYNIIYTIICMNRVWREFKTIGGYKRKDIQRKKLKNSSYIGFILKIETLIFLNLFYLQITYIHLIIYFRSQLYSKLQVMFIIYYLISINIK